MAKCLQTCSPWASRVPIVPPVIINFMVFLLTLRVPSIEKKMLTLNIWVPDGFSEVIFIGRWGGFWVSLKNAILYSYANCGHCTPFKPHYSKVFGWNRNPHDTRDLLGHLYLIFCSKNAIFPIFQPKYLIIHLKFSQVCSGLTAFGNRSYW